MPSYPLTAFNVARLGLAQGRGMVMGGRADGKAKDTPVKPWMGFQVPFLARRTVL